MGTRTKKVTSIEELKKVAFGELVELPPFVDGVPFVARLKRPSIMQLAAEGMIPNSLLTKANELFSNDRGAIDPDDENMMKDMIGVMKIIAKASFVEPTYQELEDANIELTDQQYMAIFNYTQQGVKALESFRTEPKD